MNIQNDDLLYKELPILLDLTKVLLSNIKKLSFEELKQLLSCNDDIANLNYERFVHMDLKGKLSPSILAYDGIQYKYMSPGSFTVDELNYVNKHLKILSGFYGVVKPFDGVVPYRLEMQAKLKIDNGKNLYDFWGDSIYKEVTSESNVILNLASKEYSKVVEKYLNEKDSFITCIFGTMVNGKIKIKATEAKMARGLMVRYLAQNNITSIEEVKKFNEMSFQFYENLSTERELVFLKK